MPRPRRDGRFALLLLCFFLSGLAGLVYETAWTREFGLVFGTSSLAVSTVLAAYMAGLAGGAALASRFAHRVTRPVLAYGLLELGIALAAITIPWQIAGSRWLYVALFGGVAELPESGAPLAGLFYVACSFAILIVPTAMMGATLPLLTRHAVRSESEITGRVGVLYAVNTAGAVAGTLVAAFLLMPQLGLRLTIWFAAAVNAGVFAAAWALARGAPPAAAAPAVRAAPAGPGRWILPLCFGAGAASFTYEVLWFRLLTHVFRGSTRAFAVMLGAFLLGIAIGSAVASRWGRTRRSAAIGFALSQVGAAALSIAAFFGLDAVPEVARTLYAGGLPQDLAHALISMGILFPGALCLGATFPFAVRVLARDEADASAASARALAANTLGSIAGSLGAGFFVIPWLGFAGTLRATALLNAALAGVAALRVPLPRAAVLVAVALAGIALLPLPLPWRLLGIGTDAAREADGVRYFGVGRSATVLLVESDRGWMLVANGLSEASIDPPGLWHGYLSSDRWIGALPVLARPDLASMMVVGLGGGVSLESVPRSVERIHVVELEREIVAANRAVGEERWRDPLADARVRLHVNDARNALLLSERRFDAIVSQPSYPWTGGTANLFTREFFELVESRLEPDGVFVQWLGIQLVNDPLFRSLVATLRSVFPFVRVYSPPPQGRTAVVFVASNAPLELESTAARAFARDPERFAEIGLNVSEDVAANLILDERGAREVSEGAPWNLDDRNRFQDPSHYEKQPPLLGRLDDLYAGYEPFASGRLRDLDALRLLDRLPAERAKRLAGTGAAMNRMPGLSRPIEVATARALADGSDAALAALREALADDPRHVFARAVVLRSAAEELAAGADPARLVEPPLDGAERSVAEAWRAVALEDAGAAPSAAPADDAALAAVPVEHPLFADAQRVRARWRLARGDPAQAREALPLLDRVIRSDPDDLLLRARLCAAAGDAGAALDSLWIALRLIGGSVDPAGFAAVRETLAAIPPDSAHSGLRAGLEARIRALDPLRD